MHVNKLSGPKRRKRSVDPLASATKQQAGASGAVEAVGMERTDAEAIHERGHEQRREAAIAALLVFSAQVAALERRFAKDLSP